MVEFDFKDLACYNTYALGREFFYASYVRRGIMIKRSLSRLERGRFLPQRNVTILPNFQTANVSLLIRSNILYEPKAVIFDGLKFHKTLTKRLKKLVNITKQESSSVLITAVAILTVLVSPLSSVYQPATSYAITSAKLKDDPAHSVVTSKLESNESPEFSWPVEGNISQNYTPVHKAIDVSASFNTPVKPTAAGVVESAFMDIYGLGRTIVIKHIDGTKSLYAHLNQILVKQGEEVKSEKEIGTVGLTGRTTGSHLHFEIEDNGKKINPSGVLPSK